MAKLTAKQERFVEEYLVDLNATRAGYSQKTVNEQGARLLVNVSIQAALKEAMEQRSHRTEITQDWVLEELQKSASANRATYASVVFKEHPETVFDEETVIRRS